MPQADGQSGQDPKRPETELLPHRLIRVAGPLPHQGGVVFDFSTGGEALP
jgi:hypothetical protein